MTSLGKGLGQQTGGTPESDTREAVRILSMIAGVSIGTIEEELGADPGRFIRDMRAAMAFPKFEVTGKQLFYLRDLRDRLVEKGLI